MSQYQSGDATCDAVLEFATWAARDFDREGRGVLVTVIKVPRWRVGAGGALHWGERSSPIGFELMKQLRATNKAGYERAVDAVKADPVLAPFIGGMLGTEMGTMPFDANRVVSACVTAQLQADGTFSPNASAVVAKLQEFRQFIIQESVTADLLIPLPGMSVDLASDGITCCHGMYFGRFADRQFEACADAGIIHPLYVAIPITPEFGVGCRVSLPIKTAKFKPGEVQTVGTSDRQRHKRRFGELTYWAMDELAEDILSVVRLSTNEQTAAPGALLDFTGVAGEFWSYYTRTASRGTLLPWKVDQKFLNSFERLWTALAAPSPGKSLPRICVRRFNAAADRREVDDSIADIMMAAEAIFLSDRSSHDELRYRLVTRAARFMQRHGHSYKDVINVLNAAYKMRSTVVHGGAVEDSVKIGEEKVEKAAALRRVLDFMREAISIGAVECAGNSDFGSQQYWERLFFEA